MFTGNPLTIISYVINKKKKKMELLKEKIEKKKNKHF